MPRQLTDGARWRIAAGLDYAKNKVIKLAMGQGMVTFTLGNGVVDSSMCGEHEALLTLESREDIRRNVLAVVVAPTL